MNKRAGGLAAMTPPLQGGYRKFESCSAHLFYGLVDQLEDRYLGMVEVAGSNPVQSTFIFLTLQEETY